MSSEGAACSRALSSDTTASSVTFCLSDLELDDLLVDSVPGGPGSGFGLASHLPSPFDADLSPEPFLELYTAGQAVGSERGASPGLDSLSAYQCMVLEVGTLPDRAARWTVHDPRRAAYAAPKHGKDVDAALCCRCPKRAPVPGVPSPARRWQPPSNAQEDVFDEGDGGLMGDEEASSRTVRRAVGDVPPPAPYAVLSPATISSSNDAARGLGPPPLSHPGTAPPFSIHHVASDNVLTLL